MVPLMNNGLWHITHRCSHQQPSQVQGSQWAVGPRKATPTLLRQWHRAGPQEQQALQNLLTHSVSPGGLKQPHLPVAPELPMEWEKAWPPACPAFSQGPDSLPTPAFQWEKRAPGRPPAISGRGRGAEAAPGEPRSSARGWGLPLRLAPLLRGRGARAGRGAGSERGRSGGRGRPAGCGGERRLGRRGVRSRRGGRKRGGGDLRQWGSWERATAGGTDGGTDGRREPAERHRPSSLAPWSCARGPRRPRAGRCRYSSPWAPGSATPPRTCGTAGRAPAASEYRPPRRGLREPLPAAGRAGAGWGGRACGLGQPGRRG